MRFFPPHLVVAIGFSSLAFAQSAAWWIPYTAKYRNVTQFTDLNGQVVTEKVITGTKARATNGNETSVQLDQNGASKGTFIEATTGKVFDIFYADKRAILRQVLKVPLPHRTYKDSPNGTQIISGLVCTGYPIRKGGTSGDVVGTMWVSVPNELEVRQQIFLPDSTGTRRRIWTFELTDITVGAEPAADQLGIPAGFQILSGLQGPACNSCTVEKTSNPNWK